MSALRSLGVQVDPIAPSLSQLNLLTSTAQYVLTGHGRPPTTEAVRRSRFGRAHLARQTEDAASNLAVKHVLHLGTLDLPVLNKRPGTAHYIYCDHTWSLAQRYAPDKAAYSSIALSEFERLERASFQGMTQVFTFSDFVRDNLIHHYGLHEDRVTAVGSGMGDIQPFHGAKSFDESNLLFVAKHLFAAKGGELLIRAFELARRQRPDLRLTIVAGADAQRHDLDQPGIKFLSDLSWTQLNAEYQRATLLVQPMLNDPWGQVFLESLAARTPVLGLRRNGLPEILDQGVHGFLLDEPSPPKLAESILDALSNSARLETMGRSGQRKVMNTYSWTRVAERIAFQ